MRRVFRASILGCAEMSDIARCELRGRWALFQLLSIHLIYKPKWIFLKRCRTLIHGVMKTSCLVQVNGSVNG